MKEVTEQEVREWHQSLRDKLREYAPKKRWSLLGEHIVQMGVEPLDELGRCRNEVDPEDPAAFCCGGWLHQNHRLHNDTIREIVLPYRDKLREVFLRQVRDARVRDWSVGDELVGTFTTKAYAQFLADWLK